MKEATMFLRRQSLPKLNPGEVAGRDDLQIVDVRDDYEWQAGRIEGSTHIPMSDLPARLDDIDAATPAVIVCRSGNRSAQVATFLLRQGYDASNLHGGVKAWVADGLPLTTPDGRPGRVA
jgi:rhodanese-related sulfurtransferase